MVIRYYHFPDNHFQHFWLLDPTGVILELREPNAQDDGELKLSSVTPMCAETAQKVAEMLEQGAYMYRKTKRENSRKG